MPSVREKRAWVSVLNNMIGEIVLVFFLSVLAVILYDNLNYKWVSISTLPLQIFGIALSIFLAFLNNTAYDRWWEARGLWGAITNLSRTFTRQSLTFVKTDREQEKTECEQFKNDLVCRQIAYAYALRDALRDNDPTPRLMSYATEPEIEALKKEPNLPIALLQKQGEALSKAHSRGWLTELSYMNLDNTLSEITNAQGGCERIKNTPIPAPYRVFSHNLVFFFCCAIPFGLVATTEAKTLFVATATALGFFTLERVGRMLADPFLAHANSVNLDKIVETIEISLTARINL